MDRSDDVVNLDSVSVSSRLALCWAKSGIEEGNPTALWLPLVGHALDAVGAAGHLWDHWFTPSQRRVMSAPFLLQGGDEEEANRKARGFFRLSAGLHDAGKISPTFALQVPAFADRMRREGLHMASRHSEEAKSRRWFRHALAGSLVIERRGRELGWHDSYLNALATIVGGHHGVPVDLELKQDALVTHGLLTTLDSEHEWLSTQNEFVDLMLQATGTDFLIEPIEFNTPALVLFQAAVTVADWIASSPHYFPLTPEWDTKFVYLDRVGGQRNRLDKAWQAFQQPAPWSPHDGQQSATELLISRFGLPFGARPLQDAAVRAAREAEGPPLVIIEDAMGSGKTEAAFMAAEILAARFGEEGVLVALPTQATTDAMFERLLDYLDVALAHPKEGPVNVALLHGRAQWSEAYRHLKRQGRTFLDSASQGLYAPGAEEYIEIDDPSSAAHPWFTGRYKAVLSSFVATTVDHLLMGALQMKQLPLRHLGLAGKVVIFDEAHASSDFMNFFAERVLEWLGAYSVPVVLLSATLPDSLRNRLSAAYKRGLATRDKHKAAPAPEEKAPLPGLLAPPAGMLPPPALPSPTRTVVPNNSEVSPYPRLTTVDKTGSHIVPLDPATDPYRVVVKGHPERIQTFQVAQRLAQKRQGNILVVCNTVAEAQETYRQLADEFGSAVRLFHARFTAADRLQNDAELLELYGPASTERPDFSIVVGTQVVEQSLDIDFDVLVTQLAPIDLVLQRLGRVHRHAGCTRPEQFAEPVCHVTGVPSFDTKPALHRGSERVYRPLTLLKAAAVLGPAVLSEAGVIIKLPGEIGSLVQAADRDPSIPDPWREEYTVAEIKEEDARQKSLKTVGNTLVPRPDRRLGKHATLDGWISVSGDPDARDRYTRAKVREGVEDEEVILLNEISEGVYYTMPTSEHPEGLPMPFGIEPDYKTALAAALGTVRIPHYHCQGDEALAALEELWCEEWNRSPLLKGQLFLPLTDGMGQFADRAVTYSDLEGLEITRDK